MTNWNTGKLFQRPFESDNTAIRRFLIANRITNKYRLFKRSEKRFTKDNAIVQIRKIQGEKYWSSNLWLYENTWGIHLSNVTHCPECARMCFHSYAFNHTWVKHCPIHDGVQMLTRCPECNRAWPSDFRVFNRKDCKTCGLALRQSNTERKLLTQSHTTEQTRMLSAIWELRGFDKQLCHLLYHDFVNYGLDSGVLLGSAYFPDYAYSALPKIRDVLSRVTGDINMLPMLKVKIEKIQDNSQITKNDKLLTKPKYVKLILEKAIEELALALRLNGINVKSDEVCQPIYFDINDIYCPAQIAFLVWKSIVYEFKQNVYSLQSWTRVFDILNVKIPSYPPIVHLIYHPITRTFYAPSKDYCTWMFINNLKCLYDYIYLHFNYFQLNRLYKDQYSYMKYVNKKNIRNPKPPVCSMKYRNYRLNIVNNRKLVVIYKPVLPWCDLVRHQLDICHGISDYSPYYDSEYRRFIYTTVSPNLPIAISMEAEHFLYN